MTAPVALQTRRDDVSKCLSKSIVTPKAIFDQLSKSDPQITLAQIKHDLRWMTKNSRKWLAGHALHGFVFSTQNTLEQLRDIELELQSMRTTAQDIPEKLAIIHELKDTINMRWVLEGEGPTLMTLTKRDAT